MDKWTFKYPFISSLILLLGIALVMGYFWYEHPFVRINSSSSLPHYVYFVSSQIDPLEKGQIVSLNHPAFANVTLAKIIGAKPGDQIFIRNDTIFINDFEICQIKTKSSSGKEYHPLAEGQIPEDYYFVYATHPESFDSRYAEFGLIHSTQIKEVLWPLF